MAGHTQRLMSEDEVLRYFVVNGGLVRNNDIVTHFRTYLANPAIRDEARTLFKVIVNKLATVKVENGEKYLVLKRQYFHPIDGNGNPSPPVLSHSLQYLDQSSPSTTSTATNFTPFPFQAPPPYVRSTYESPLELVGPSPLEPEHPRSHQQPNYYQKTQSQYALNTSGGDVAPQYQSNAVESRKSFSGSRADYEFGLPPPPPLQSAQQRRLSFGSPPIGMPPVAALGSSPGRQVVPPPYRPPPPVMNPTTPPSRPIGTSPFHNYGPHQQPPRPPVHYRRTQSVTALRNSSSVSVASVFENPPVNCSSNCEPTQSQSATNSTTSPPPPVPPRAKRSSSFVEPKRINMEEGERIGDEKENKKPTISITAADGSDEIDDIDSPATDDSKISVRERMQKFNVQEQELSPPKQNGIAPGTRTREGSKDSGDYDTSSLSSFSYAYAPEPKAREWILKAAKCDYAGINKMAQEMPSLVRRKDMNGYTSLHWAAKHGHVELVKLLAGTYKSNVNAKSNGGYTPLHLAAQFSRQEVYDILIKVYNADSNLRDHGGKKPTQYLARQDTCVSAQTVKKLKDKRRSVMDGGKEKDHLGNAFLRIGSLNVRVKKTTEAFGNFLAKSSSSSNVEKMTHKKWGSADSLPESENDKTLMPPPSKTSVLKYSGGSTKSRKNKNRKSLQIPFTTSTPPRPASTNSLSERAMSEDRSGSESDNDKACGFGSDWKRIP